MEEIIKELQPEHIFRFLLHFQHSIFVPPFIMEQFILLAFKHLLHLMQLYFHPYQIL